MMKMYVYKPRELGLSHFHEGELRLEGFEKTELYVKFQEKIRIWAEGVAQTLLQAPPWKEEWLDEPMPELPDIKKPNVPQPLLG